MGNRLRQGFAGASRCVQYFTEPEERCGRWIRSGKPVSGLVADDASVYALTANGPFDAISDYGDSALRLGPTLNYADSFTPCNQQELGDMDVDLGSGGMMILPDQEQRPHQAHYFRG